MRAGRAELARALGHGLEMFPWQKRRNLKSPQSALDEELCASAVSGNADAFQELFERYWDQVFRLTFAIVRSDAEAEDVAQSVFVELHCRAREFDPARGSFCNWLLRYAYTRAIDHKRYLHARRFYAHDEFTPEVLADLGREPVLILRLAPEEASHLIRQLLGQLQEKPRLIVQAYFFQGRSLQEIASEIGETYGNARHLLYRRLSPISGIVGYQQFAIFNGLNGPTGAVGGRTLSTTVNAFQPVVLISTEFSSYVQDAWRVSPRQTLTYGVRWDVNPSPGGKDGKDPFAVAGVQSASALTLAPAGRALYETAYGNFAPRLGLAYQLNQHSGWETVLRGGAGVFYDLGTGFLGQLTIGAPFTSRKPLGAVAFPLTPAQAAPLPFSSSPPVTGPVFAADPSLKLPRTYQWNFALEQSISGDQVISATYIGAIGRKLLRQEQFQAPNATFNSNAVTITRNTATSDYHALQLQYRRRLSRGVQALSSYTWSHSIDIASADSMANNTPGAVADPSIDRGNSSFDVRHSFTGAITYDAPTPARAFARAFLGGWSLDSFVFARSALPVDVIGATAVFAGTTFQTRPDLVPGIPLYLFGSQYPGGKAFNFTADPSRPNCKGPFCPAASGQQGNFGRNVLRGFGAWQADFAVRRQFRIADRFSLQFRSEFFNIFNHPNFGNPLNMLSSPSFGQSAQTLAKNLGSGGSGGGFSPLYQVGGPRSIQFGLKLAF